jgi:hypothetical protein
VEGTKRLEISAGGRKGEILAQKLNYVQFLFDFFNRGGHNAWIVEYKKPGYNWL